MVQIMLAGAELGKGPEDKEETDAIEPVFVQGLSSLFEHGVASNEEVIAGVMNLLNSVYGPKHQIHGAAPPPSSPAI